MKTSIVPQPPHLQCTICGQADADKIKVVCHRCGRAFCDDHAKAPPWAWFSRLWEFTGVDLPMERQDIVHCKECIREQLNERSIFSYLVKLGIHIRFPGVHFFVEERPYLPVVPRITTEALETLRGEITLNDEGKYSSSKAKEASGQLNITMQFTNRDRDRFNLYRQRSRLEQNAPLRVHAGFALLKGTSTLQFDPRITNYLLREDTLALTDDVQQQAFFTGIGAYQDSKWKLLLDYRVSRSDQNEIPLPVQIIPTLVHDGAQQSIELALQLRSDVKKYIDFESAKIDQFIMRAPIILGAIKDVHPSALIGKVSREDAEATLTAEWKDTIIPDKEKFRVFAVQFENELKRDMTLTGELTITFFGTLSQLKDVRLFTAWGTLRKTESLVRRTQVKVNFSLNLNTLTFQALYMPPTEQKDYSGVIPNSEFVTRLANELSGMDMYVRKVVENPVRTSKIGAHINTLLWDVEGRRYQGVFPIDFHLVLAGETNEGNPQSNTMKVEITTQGMASDDLLRDKVTGLKNDILAAIEKVYQELIPKTSVPPDHEEPRFEEAALAGMLANLAEQLQQRLQGR